MENRGLSSLPASHSYGTTEGILPIAEMSGANGAYGVGACEGLDGEITIFKGKPYVTKVRGDGFIMDNSQSGTPFLWHGDLWRLDQEHAMARHSDGATNLYLPMLRPTTTCSASSRLARLPPVSTPVLRPSPFC
jgi:hypothetical protein